MQQLVRMRQYFRDLIKDNFMFVTDAQEDFCYRASITNQQQRRGDVANRKAEVESAVSHFDNIKSSFFV